MFWNKKEQSIATAVIVEEPKPVVVEPAPVEEKKETVPFGQRAHGLTRFGKTWINLDELLVLEFKPPDGCGAECRFKESSKAWHIPTADAAAIKLYLEGMEATKDIIESAKP